MATDRGDLWNFQNMTDDEIRQVVLQQVREHPNLDAGWIDVDVSDGLVTLSGRVGTDGELQVIENLVADVLGLDRYTNELVVDELHRGEMPMAIDEELAAESEADDPLAGRSSQHSDTAEHLAENLETDTYGTHDVGKAIQDGTAYVPPDSPTSDGYDSRENH